MDRATLAWYSCSLCGRKGAVYDCEVDGRRTSLCPYCALALSSAGRKVSCRGIRLPSLRAPVRQVEADVEELVARVRGGLSSKSSKAGRPRRGSSYKRGGSRRRYSAGAT